MTGMSTCVSTRHSPDFDRSTVTTTTMVRHYNRRVDRMAKAKSANLEYHMNFNSHVNAGMMKNFSESALQMPNSPWQPIPVNSQLVNNPLRNRSPVDCRTVVNQASPVPPPLPPRPPQGLKQPGTLGCKSPSPGKQKHFGLPKFKGLSLRKLRRQMGLVNNPGYTSSAGGSPIHFHSVHGDNVRISADGSIAKRAESFCKGVAFSSRPIKINEKVYVRFHEIATNWSGVLRFGFTSNDPIGLQGALPKYACPDLTNKPGYWAKALSERFAERDTLLHYYVNSAGDVHFGINGDDKGVFFTGVDTRGPVWAMFDIYGNTTTVELIDPRQHLNNARTEQPTTEADGSERCTAQLSTLQIQSPSPNHHQKRPIEQRPPISTSNNSSSMVNSAEVVPLHFHKNHGRNIQFSNFYSVASRNDTEFCHGYVFTSRPIRLGERIILQVLSTEEAYLGSLTFGLTACDPNRIRGTDLPEDADLLIDRPEYWVVNKNVASSPEVGDELSFSVSPDGEVLYSRNGAPPTTIMHVDSTPRLWMFFDVYGSTQKVRLLGSVPPTGAPTPNAPVIAPTQCSVSRSEPIYVSHPNRPAQQPLSTSQQQSYQQHNQSNLHNQALIVKLPPAGIPPSSPGPSHSVSRPLSTASSHSDAGLVVNLAPSLPGATMPHSQREHHAPQTATMGSNYSRGNYADPVTLSAYSTMDTTFDSSMVSTRSECTICYEKPVDSVLYMCGHMCMCYACALQQWRGKGGGQCPICRAIIRDVIRTYKS